MIWKPPPPIPQSFESLSTLMADARGRNWYWLIYPLAECCKNLPKIGQSRATSGRKDRSNLKANLRVRSSLNNWAGSHATRDSSLSYHDTTLPTDLSFEGFAELLSAADKYQVPSLIDFCVMKLRENISTDNAVQGAILGSLYRNQDLKKDAIKAIVNVWRAPRLSRPTHWDSRLLPRGPSVGQIWEKKDGFACWIWETFKELKKLAFAPRASIQISKTHFLLYHINCLLLVKGQ